VGQTTADTEIWVHDANRVPLAGFGNDDTIGPPTSTQSTLTRTYVPGTHHLAISTFNMCNNLASPADDNFDDGAVMDFPNVIVNNVTTLNQDVDHLIDGIPVTALKQGAFDIVFVQFVVTVPVELTGFSIE
jgi:hypothetical protein